jgi:hypothetical protein
MRLFRTAAAVLLFLMWCAPAGAQQTASTEMTDPGVAVFTIDPDVSLFSPDVPLFSIGQQTAPPAQPQHTGFKALIYETASDFKAFPRRTSTWVILAIGGGAAALVLPVDKEVTE